MSDRNQTFFKQRVTAAELNEYGDRIELGDRDLAKDFLGFGWLISGTNPATAVQNTTPDLTVLVNRCLGYDQTGRRLTNVRTGYQGGTDKGLPPQRIDLAVDEVGASTSVTLAGQEKTISVFLQFRRHQTDPRTDGNGATVNWRQDESIQFNVVQSAQAAAGSSVPPPLRTDQLLLFDVVLTFGQTTVTTAQVLYTRRQGFVFSLLHASAHLSSGGDPIPGATTTVGGLLSAADKTKLDGVTFTAAGVAALFNKQLKLFVPATPTVTAPAATSLDVTSRFTGQAAGGSATKEAVVTSGADNKVEIVDDANKDEILDSKGNRVFGRLTVDNETTPTAWTLSFKVIDGASEVAFDMSPHSGKTLRIAARKAYALNNLPTAGTADLLDRDQVAGLGAVPVGAVMPWMAPTAGSPLPAAPAGYEYCDGTTVATVGSPLFGRTKPSLCITAAGGVQRFVRGADASSVPYGGANALTTGGADTHSHVVNAHNHGGSISGTSGNAGTHSHTVPDTSSVGAATPAPNTTLIPGVAPQTGLINNTGSFNGLMYSHVHNVPSTSTAPDHSHSISGSIPNDSPGTNTASTLPAHVHMLFILRVI